MLTILIFLIIELEDHNLGTEDPKLVLFWINVCPPVGASSEVRFCLLLKYLYPQTQLIAINRIAAPDVTTIIIQ